MTDFLKIAKSIVVHFAHICAYGVETVKSALVTTLWKENYDLKKEVHDLREKIIAMQDHYSKVKRLNYSEAYLHRYTS